LEEIPGEETLPAYLDSSIKAIYERTGIIRTNDGSVGSLTMIGTVSPAGGNFEEPVTQSTLSTVKTFLGLSAERAYKRFYPAVDILISWSRYLNQLAPWFQKNVAPDWVDRVQAMLTLLKQGASVDQMMQVTGEEGVTLDDFILYQKSLFLDMVYLQQDAFDDVDASAPLDRQKKSFDLVCDLVNRQYKCPDKKAARDYFTRLTGLYKNLNYTRENDPNHADYLKQIHALADSVS
jgi:V/A-type H+-transporting ATPase subunit A